MTKALLDRGTAFRIQFRSATVTSAGAPPDQISLWDDRLGGRLVKSKHANGLDLRARCCFTLGAELINGVISG